MQNQRALEAKEKRRNKSFSFWPSEILYQNINGKDPKKVSMFRLIRRKSCCCEHCGQLTTFEKTTENLSSDIKNTLMKRRQSIMELITPTFQRTMRTRFTQQVPRLSLLHTQTDKKATNDMSSQRSFINIPQQSSRGSLDNPMLGSFTPSIPTKSKLFEDFLLKKKIRKISSATSRKNLTEVPKDGKIRKMIEEIIYIYIYLNLLYYI